MQTLEDIAKETFELENVEFCAIHSRMFPPKLNAATFGESAVWSHKNTTVISDRPFNINNDSCVIIRPDLKSDSDIRFVLVIRKLGWCIGKC